MTKPKYKLLPQSDGVVITDDTIKNLETTNKLLKIFLCCIFLTVLIFYTVSTSENENSLHFTTSTSKKCLYYNNESDEKMIACDGVTDEFSIAANTASAAVTKIDATTVRTSEFVPNIMEVNTTIIQMSTTDSATNREDGTTAMIVNKTTDAAATTNTFAAVTTNLAEAITNTFAAVTTDKINKVSTENTAVASTTERIPTTNVTVVIKTTTPSLTTKTNVTVTTKAALTNTTTTTTVKTPLPATPKYMTKLKYYVNTTHCHMPVVDPFTKDLKKIFKPQKYSNCTNDVALINVIYDSITRKYILHTDMKAMKNYVNSSDDLSCCYQQVVRTGSGGSADNNYKLLPCSNFHQDFVVPDHIDAMIVDCIVKSTNKSVQQDAFSFIQYRNVTVKNITATNKKRPNVLLIGIDSLSRFNFRRNMPKTFEFLTENDWFEMQGYNKMGDNTYPNLMALLMGLNETTAYSICKPKTAGGLDNCNFIWKRYKEAGYRTAYAEDTVMISTFNYLKKGFTKPPTDYYLRPMMLAIEKKMKVTKKYGLAYCIGRKHYGEYIYDYAVQLAEQYRDEPIFGLFWTNSFSHNKYDTSATMDVKMLEYFENFKKSGVLKNSIILFFSDHGCRWGPLLSLPEGFLEERLPMLFMSLPQWFQKEHPDFVDALKVNQNRLTSPYDVHLTLRHILELYETVPVPPSKIDCEKCQSLFREVPENRTCEDVGVSDHWCTCIPYSIVSKSNSDVKKITNLIIDEMNKYLANKNLSSLCAKLEVRAIKSAQIKIEEHEIASLTPTYRIKYSTKPKEALFQATATYDNHKKSVNIDVEDISRLNLYADDSKCITDKEAKKYCICKQ